MLFILLIKSVQLQNFIMIVLIFEINIYHYNDIDIIITCIRFE